MIDWTKIDDLAKQYNVPDWIWKPIMETESEGNSSAVTKSSSEASFGLFQINRKVHTQYSYADLLDPYKNAEIAFRDFISPAISYLTTKGVKDPQQLAEGVYSGIDPTTGNYYDSSHGGIRPSYTASTQNRFLTNLKNFINGVKIISGAVGAVKDTVKNPVETVKDAVVTGTEYLILHGVITLGLVIVLIILLFKMFPETSSTVVNLTKTAITKGVA